MGRLNELTGHVTYIAPVLRVEDLARSLAFYRDQLGFTVEFVHENFYADVQPFRLRAAIPASRRRRGP
jgi:catechol 2,3-dioxygenase-like lactoylglutathione lyase family enzyme